MGSQFSTRTLKAMSILSGIGLLLIVVLGIAAIVVGMLLVLISKRALKNDTRDRPMRLVAYRIVTTGAPASPGLTSHEPDFTGT